MNKKIYTFPALLAIVAMLVLSACSPSVQLETNSTTDVPAAGNNNPVVGSTSSDNSSATQPAVQSIQPQATTAPSTQTQAPAVGANNLLQAYQSTLESIYNKVDPSVVSVHVITQATSSTTPRPSADQWPHS